VKTKMPYRYKTIDLPVKIFIILLDFLGSIIFYPVKFFKKRYDPNLIKKILVVRLDGVGDVVLSTAAFREIRKYFKDAHITLLVSTWARNIVKYSKNFDEVIIFDYFFFKTFRSKNLKFSKDVVEFFNIIKRLRQERFDLAIDLRGDIFTIIFSFLSGAKFRFGLADGGGGFLLTNPIWLKGGPVSAVERTLRICRELGIASPCPELEVNIVSENKEKVKGLLLEQRVGGEDTVITISPLSLFKWKSWPKEKFAELIEKLLTLKNTKILLVGSESEKDTIDEIIEMAGGGINLAGKLDLLELASLLACSSLYIGNDSGPTHIAYAMKTPMIQLFGPGEPEIFGHFDEKSILIMNDNCSCRPCTQRKCKNEKDWCMDKISVEEVFSSAKKLLSKRKETIGEI